jgi:hypothetical protein
MKSINVKRENGDTIKIWIRAEDSMGNVAADYTTVSIDTTAPTVTSAEMHEKCPFHATFIDGPLLWTSWMLDCHW